MPSVTGANLGNYTQSVSNGTLTITKAPLAVKADDASRRYGAANPSFTGTVTGAINGDAVAASFSTVATSTSAAGTYPIVPAISGAAAGNYTPSITNGTLTISGAPLTVSADDASRVYGAANPNFTGSLTGALNGDQLTESFTTQATQASPAGRYAIVPSAAGAGIGNYVPVTTNGTLTITPAALTVQAANASRVYGDSNPAFTATITGSANGETFTQSFTTPATPQSAVGAYPVTPSVTGATLGNYTLTALPGTLTIAPATLNMSVANAQRAYGTPNPAFTGSITGVRNGDNLQATYTSMAAITDAPGSYPILANVTGSALGNYTVVPASGVLTIVKAGSSTTLTRAAGAPAADGTITLQAQVQSLTSGTPSGTVQFFNGTTSLGVATLQSGTATLNTKGVPANVSNSLTAVYAGDTNFLTSTSGQLTVQLSSSNFWIRATIPTGASGSSSASPITQTVALGGQANFPLQVGPGQSGAYPGVVTFSVTGLPTGATATFSPATLAADSGAQTVTLSVQVPANKMVGAAGQRLSTALGGTALALVLLPLAGASRLRKSGRGLALTLLLLLGGLAGSSMLTGCGVTRGTAWTQGATYDLTITMSSGGAQQTTTAQLTVQQ